MKIVADLHIHSKYSRATSGKMNAKDLSDAAKIKGINLLGTGDFTHPTHLADLKAALKGGENGVFQFNETNFILTSEIANLFSWDGKGRKVHNVLLAPSFEIVDQIVDRLLKWGRLDYDGRPMFGRTCLELMDLVQSISKDIVVIPAHCFVPGTRVFCNPKTKPIEKISKNDIVLTHKGNFKRVKNVLSRQYSGITYTMIPWYMREGVTCTPEHPFYAIKTKKKCTWTNGTCRPTCLEDSCTKKDYKNYTPAWISAENLEIGDVLLYPRYKKINDLKELKFNKSNKKIKLDQDFYRFLGYYVAEGYSNRRDGIGFALSINENEYAEDIKNIVLKIFGIKPKEVHTERPNIEFIFYSKNLMHFIENLCYSSKEKNASTKSLPSFALFASPKKQAELFRGWWRGDKGYTVSVNLKEQMKQISFRLGIIPSISIDTISDYNKRGNHFIKNRSITAKHDLHIFSNLSFFNDDFDLLSDPAFKKYSTKRDTRHGWIDENYAYLPIREINKHHYNGEVFNLEVEGDNSYVVETGAVHNCWTPWFGVFGSSSGFDSLKDAFQEHTKDIFAIETGMSSDPAMNWRLSSLDAVSLVSFSDAHSPYPWRLGREACVFELDKPDYYEMVRAVKEKDKKKFLYTIETDPAYGKYHYDGHRNCNTVLSPEEAKKYNNICPVCRKPLTIGVEHRVEDLADRPVGYVPKEAIPFRTLLSLSEIIAGVYDQAVASKKVYTEFNQAISLFGNELNILLDLPEEKLRKGLNEKVAATIMKGREGKIKIKPGYDGVYGVPMLEEKEMDLKPKHQKSLLDY